MLPTIHDLSAITQERKPDSSAQQTTTKPAEEQKN